MSFSRGLICLGALSLAATSAARAQQQGTIILDQHKAVYDLELDTTVPSKNVDGARGRIAFDFTGDACDGYALSFRQVTQLQSSEGGTRTIDSRQTTFEDGAAQSFRFKSESRAGQGAPDLIDGAAQRAADGYQVNILKPKPGQFTLGQDVMFPSAQIKAIITAARSGETTYGVRVFDGSDDGRQVYDTLAVIGHPAAPAVAGHIEEPLRGEAFAKMERWPVTISYFKQGAGEATPSYRVSFDLYENGVTGAVRMHYGEFSLKATLTRLDLLPRSACAK